MLWWLGFLTALAGQLCSLSCRPHPPAGQLGLIHTVESRPKEASRSHCPRKRAEEYKVLEAQPGTVSLLPRFGARSQIQNSDGGEINIISPWE